MRLSGLIITAVIFLLTSACSTNPVTGKNELSLISEAQELSIGQKQYAPLRQSQGGDYEVDAKVAAYVNEVGQRLAAVSDRKLPYEFKVLNNSVPNAWALPGGKIAINRGLLTELNSEAELAAVLGHEIVHAAAKHSAQGMSRGMLLQGLVVAASIATQGKSYANAAEIGARGGDVDQPGTHTEQFAVENVEGLLHGWISGGGHGGGFRVGACLAFSGRS